MLVHSVYFWLKPEVSKADRAAFRKGLETLHGINTVEQMFIGTPAASEERDVIDSSYDFALTVVFKDLDALNAYAVAPLHEALLKDFASMWRKVTVYDAE